MKSCLLILCFFLLLIEIGCDPARNVGGVFHFNLQGTLNNISGTINFGDTLKFEVQLPSSITATNLDGDSRTETVNSLQRAFYGFHLFRVDTINHKVYSYIGDSMKINYYLNPGYQINPCQPCYGGSAYLQNSSIPYICILHMIPQVKGVFIFQVDLQEGNFEINNNFNGLFSVSINAPNKHLDLVDRYIPGFANGTIQSGIQVYCFEVK